MNTSPSNKLLGYYQLPLRGRKCTVSVIYVRAPLGAVEPKEKSLS